MGNDTEERREGNSGQMDDSIHEKVAKDTEENKVILV